MANLVSLSIDVTKITKSKLKDGKYLNLTLSTNNEVNEWGKNVGIWEEQTKEERERKAQKNYLGSGKVVWTDGENVNPAPKNDAPVSAKKKVDIDDLPF